MTAEIGTEVAPAMETSPAAATGAIDGSDSSRGKGKKKPEPTADTREFWETWAEEKSTRPEPTASASTSDADADAATAGSPAQARGRSRDRGDREGSDRAERGARGRGRDRGRGAEKGDGDAKPAASAEKPERGSRTKRDTDVNAASAAETAQARLFISLGKKHGVSADDLRALLAGPLGGDKARIGSVSLRDSHAHVRVPEDTVDAIIAAVHGTQHNEHEVTVERARP